MIFQLFRALSLISAATVLKSYRLSIVNNNHWVLRGSTTDENVHVDQSKQPRYCEDVTRTIRRPARTVTVGPTCLGSAFPVAKQTMTTTNTKDVEMSVEQILRIADEGANLVRLTVQGRFEADACMKIRQELWNRNCNIPLVADIHFAPAVALRVADAFEKVRVNPGNFADGIKSFENKVYNTREEFDADVVEIEKLFAPLVLKCKELNRAIRIGTNHGSLSARVMSFWGDSPRGMVESAVEFANICRKHDYHNFVFSMKASNPLVMVQAYRLLAAEMYKRQWDYPLHLGVTEAGEGEDGRMKSAIGIGALLADGLGDTVRVSLTEDPEFELKPCQKLIDLGEELLNDPSKFASIPPWKETYRSYFNVEKRKGRLPEQQPSDPIDVRGFLNRDGSVISILSPADLENENALYQNLGAKTVVGMPFRDIATSDSLFLPQLPSPDNHNALKVLKRLQDCGIGIIAPLNELQRVSINNGIALLKLSELSEQLPSNVIRTALKISGLESDKEFQTFQSYLANSNKPIAIVVDVPRSTSRIHASRRVFELLHKINCDLPVIHMLNFDHVQDKDELILRSGFEAGALLVDGLGDGVMMHSKNFELNMLRSTSFNLLQGCRMRSTKTDFVSCPSCGRTLFDLQEVTEQIKKRTGHLPGVAIAIMGCIVNGPGEMADADFGYVGGAPGKVDLYVGKTVVKRAIPNAEACDALVQLIKDNGRWQEPQLAGTSVPKQKVNADAFTSI